ncbi:jmjC domain-containing protein 4-like [Elysia marginata]|uniref:Jumonji domain-containing protein 4 n=1 Tax=Elysia marginata TaxID=1093978 RepID=A0AAV4G213_9GAST|nr:jmjC domain-containing protein 4-like [Elysia marginata]
MFLFFAPGEAIGPVADCNGEEFCAHPKTTMKVEDFISYWQQYKEDGYPRDGQCLYLKDWHFTKRFPAYSAYTTPACLCSDWLNEFYDTVEAEHDGSDDYRFVYMGPKGSWTPFHSDVLRSYSWSANICGRKKWIFFPPGVEEMLKDPYGQLVFDLRSDDLADLKKYPNAAQALDQAIVITQSAGEIVFVPSGWHHQVFNLEDTISINHNWMNGCSIQHTWDFLKTRLGAVQREIADCQEMDAWDGQCQMILKADAGMDYAGFYTLVTAIARNRLLALKEYVREKDLCQSTTELTGKRTPGEEELQGKQENCSIFPNEENEHPTESQSKKTKYLSLASAEHVHVNHCSFRAQGKRLCSPEEVQHGKDQGNRSVNGDYQFRGLKSEHKEYQSRNLRSENGEYQCHDLEIQHIQHQGHYKETRNGEYQSHHLRSQNGSEHGEYKSHGVESEHKGHNVESEHGEYKSHMVESEHGEHNGHGVESEYSEHNGHGEESEYSARNGHGVESEHGEYKSCGVKSEHNGHGVGSEHGEHNGHGVESEHGKHNGHGIKSRRSDNKCPYKNGHQRQSKFSHTEFQHEKYSDEPVEQNEYENLYDESQPNSCQDLHMENFENQYEDNHTLDNESDLNIKDYEESEALREVSNTPHRESSSRNSSWPENLFPGFFAVEGERRSKINCYRDAVLVSSAYLKDAWNMLSSDVLPSLLKPDDEEEPSEQFSYEDEPDMEPLYEQEPEHLGNYEPEPCEEFRYEDEPALGEGIYGDCFLGETALKVLQGLTTGNEPVEVEANSPANRGQPEVTSITIPTSSEAVSASTNSSVTQDAIATGLASLPGDRVAENLASPGLNSISCPETTATDILLSANSSTRDAATQGPLQCENDFTLLAFSPRNSFTAGTASPFIPSFTETPVSIGNATPQWVPVTGFIPLSADPSKGASMAGSPVLQENNTSITKVTPGVNDLDAGVLRMSSKQTASTNSSVSSPSLEADRVRGKSNSALSSKRSSVSELLKFRRGSPVNIPGGKLNFSKNNSDHGQLVSLESSETRVGTEESEPGADSHGGDRVSEDAANLHEHQSFGTNRLSLTHDTTVVSLENGVSTSQQSSILPRASKQAENSLKAICHVCSKAMGSQGSDKSKAARFSARKPQNNDEMCSDSTSRKRLDFHKTFNQVNTKITCWDCYCQRFFADPQNGDKSHPERDHNLGKYLPSRSKNYEPLSAQSYLKSPCGSVLCLYSHCIVPSQKILYHSLSPVTGFSKLSYCNLTHVNKIKEESSATNRSLQLQSLSPNEHYSYHKSGNHASSKSNEKSVDFPEGITSLVHENSKSSLAKNDTVKLAKPTTPHSINTCSSVDLSNQNLSPQVLSSCINSVSVSPKALKVSQKHSNMVTVDDAPNLSSPQLFEYPINTGIKQNPIPPQKVVLNVDHGLCERGPSSWIRKNSSVNQPPGKKFESSKSYEVQKEKLHPTKDVRQAAFYDPFISHTENHGDFSLTVLDDSFSKSTKPPYLETSLEKISLSELNPYLVHPTVSKGCTNLLGMSKGFVNNNIFTVLPVTSNPATPPVNRTVTSRRHSIPKLFRDPIPNETPIPFLPSLEARTFSEPRVNTIPPVKIENPNSTCDKPVQPQMVALNKQSGQSFFVRHTAQSSTKSHKKKKKSTPTKPGSSSFFQEQKFHPRYSKPSISSKEDVSIPKPLDSSKPVGHLKDRPLSSKAVDPSSESHKAAGTPKMEPIYPPSDRKKGPAVPKWKASAQSIDSGQKSAGSTTAVKTAPRGKASPQMDNQVSVTTQSSLPDPSLGVLQTAVEEPKSRKPKGHRKFIRKWKSLCCLISSPGVSVSVSSESSNLSPRKRSLSALVSLDTAVATTIEKPVPELKRENVVSDLSSTPASKNENDAPLTEYFSSLPAKLRTNISSFFKSSNPSESDETLNDPSSSCYETCPTTGGNQNASAASSLPDHRLCPHWAHCGPYLALFDLRRVANILRDMQGQKEFPSVRDSLPVYLPQLENWIAELSLEMDGESGATGRTSSAWSFSGAPECKQQ